MPGKFSNAFGAPNARAFDAPQAATTQPNQGLPGSAGPPQGGAPAVPPPGSQPGGPAAGPGQGGGNPEAESALANSLTQAADAMSAAGPTENVKQILQEFFVLVAGHVSPETGQDVIAQAQGQAPPPGNAAGGLPPA